MIGNKCAEIHAKQKNIENITEPIVAATEETDLIILQLKYFADRDTYLELRDELKEMSNGRILLVPSTIQALEGLKVSRWLPIYEPGKGRQPWRYRCYICQNINEHATKYCPNCGARMEEQGWEGWKR